MNVLKSFFLWSAKTSLHIILAVWLLVAALVMLVGTSTPLKQTLANSNAYEQINDYVVESVRVENPGDNSAINKETLLIAADTAFPASEVKGHSETVIDSFYEWLNGKAPEPSFKIDLTSNKNIFIASLVDQASKGLVDRPVCTSVPNTTDVFALDCLPPGTSVSQLKTQAAAQLASESDFLKDPVITIEDFSDPKKSSSFADQNQGAPKQFKELKQAPAGLALLALILAGGIVFISNTRRQGIKSVGRILISSGALVLFVSILVGLILPNTSETYAIDIAGEQSPALAEFVKSLLRLVAVALIKTSGLLVGTGLVILIAEKSLKHQDIAGQESTDPDTTPKNSV